ncbi:ATP-binding cassette domain-containing protein [Emcibacter sp.]|uniref:ATP-binding cassette domain-containing protein n=1 Tax=Emcibacter sp. TaxID=1979954 RepID=UPI002AA87DD3|nr:ATP-binding cassette domain-containing protein [Emcibacter sp.]
MKSLLPLRLEKIYYRPAGNDVLKNISLTLEKDKITILLGPNGAGKSSLLKICHGLAFPSSGTLKWASEESVGRRQTMIFTTPVLLRRTVGQNLSYVLDHAGIDRTQGGSLIQEMLGKFGLLNLIDRPARSLSTGEQQKISMIRAFLLSPEVIFLDEPTAHLDPHATAFLEKMMQEFHHKGTSLVMTTHDLMQARRLADNVIFMQDGHIVEAAPATDFFSNPREQASRDFLEGKIS